MYFANCDVILIFRDACRHRPVKVIISCGGHWSVSQNGRSIELAARAQTKVVVVIVVRSNKLQTQRTSFRARVFGALKLDDIDQEDDECENSERHG